jgi:CubicO group peptidase (beta-lactamase class C family)
MESTQIDQALRRAGETKEIPGVVAIAATGKELIYEGAFGKCDLSKHDPMTTDTVFWIASMTKAITCAAAMQLVEPELTLQTISGDNHDYTSAEITGRRHEARGGRRSGFRC